MPIFLPVFVDDLDYYSRSSDFLTVRNSSKFSTTTVQVPCKSIRTQRKKHKMAVFVGECIEQAD